MKQLTRLRRGSDSSTKSIPLDTPENNWEKDVVPKDENPLFYFARRLASQSTACASQIFIRTVNIEVSTLVM